MSHRWAWVSGALLSATMISGALSSAGAGVIYSDNFNSDTPGLNTTPSGWTLTQGSVDTIGAGTPYDFYPGNGLYIDLNGSTNQYGGIEETTYLFGPGTYSVAFNLGSSQGGQGGVDAGSTPKITDIFFTDNSSSTQAVSLPSTPADWTYQVLTFTLTNPGYLVFQSATDPNIGSPANQDVGNILDNVQVSTTPLPATWTMLLAGFIGLGFMAYRGRNKASAVLA
jgi:hypothetical protein